MFCQIIDFCFLFRNPVKEIIDILFEHAFLIGLFQHSSECGKISRSRVLFQLFTVVSQLGSIQQIGTESLAESHIDICKSTFVVGEGSKMLIHINPLLIVFE